MNDKDFYMCCLITLKELCKNGSISEKKCKELTGIYYKDVIKELKEKEALYNIGYSEFEIDDNAKTLIETKYYERIIENIEDNEYRINLDNESKIATINNTKIAKWALWLSILSLTGIVQDLISWIWIFIKHAVEDYF